MRLPRSLQGRLLVLVVGMVSGVWLIAAVMTWFDVRHELDELLDSHLAQAAALLVVQQIGEIENDHHAVDAPTLHRYAPLAFQVFHEGRLALRSANAPQTPMVATGERFRSGFRSVHIAGDRWRVFAAHGAERDVQVYVGERMDTRMDIVWASLRSTLWPMAVAMPLLGLAIWWALHRGVAPLRGLSAQLAIRNPDELQPVVLKEAPSEIVPVVESLNGLLRRIGLLLELERRFTADAAHELRTPIAAIRAQVEVALGERAGTAEMDALHATLEGCARASRLVDQLLTLSRLESGGTVARSRVDLSAVAREVIAELAPHAVAKDQNIGLDAPSTCEVEGDAMLLAVLVRNLVDNAIRYSPAGAAIAVGVTAGRGALFTVDDGGAGMTPKDIAKLGARFFRVPGSDASGSGLGWSIVRRIANVHDAAVHVASSATHGGLRVEVRFRRWGN